MIPAKFQMRSRRQSTSIHHLFQEDIDIRQLWRGQLKKFPRFRRIFLGTLLSITTITWWLSSTIMNPNIHHIFSCQHCILNDNTCHESTSSSYPEVTDQPPLPNLPRNAWELHRHRNFHNDHVVSTHPRNDNHKTWDVEWWKRVIAALKKTATEKSPKSPGWGW